MVFYLPFKKWTAMAITFFMIMTRVTPTNIIKFLLNRLQHHDTISTMITETSFCYDDLFFNEVVHCITSCIYRVKADRGRLIVHMLAW